MTERPTGTVTFLFTDIEGSTRLWEEHPEDMKAALARHDEIVRTAIETSGGYIFATGGDGFAAAFPTADRAASAALEAQRLLTAESFPGDLDVGVRMGIHAGTADERNGDYFGQTPTRTARIMAAAWGGQILASAVAAGLMAGTVERHPLGPHRLADLDAPVDLVEVGAPDAGPGPRPRTLDTHVHNLPVLRSHFVGRDDDVESVAARISRHAAVTLTGVGGVGKTRLAIHAAASVVDRFEDGVWFVELAPVADDVAVYEAVAAALGVHRQGSSWSDAIAQRLSSTTTLLVLDNCEHVIDTVADLTEAILSSATGCHVLMTSREGLGLDGEHLIAVRPLATDGDDRSPSVELFLDRAATSGAAIDDLDVSVVTDICRRLDGVPLAIELAAARVRSMSVTEVNERLHERFRLLRGGRRRTTERHQTLRSTVDWSYQLLDADQQHMFDRLSVFAGGFDLRAATAVCGAHGLDETDVPDLVGELVEKSMLEAIPVGAGAIRYRLLETLRQYGEERLDEAGVTDDARRSHAEYFAQWVEEADRGIRGPDEARWVADFDREIDNLRAAFEWAVGVGDLALAARIPAASHEYGQWRIRYEYLSWAEALAQTPGFDHATPLAPQVLALAAYGSFHRTLLDEAVELGERAEQVERSRRLAPCWTVQNVRSLAAAVLGDFDAAVFHSSRELEIASAQRDPYRLTATNLHATWIHVMHAPERAAGHATQALEAAAAAQNPTALSLGWWADGLIRLGTEDGRAVTSLQRSVAHAKSVGNRWVHNVVAISLGGALVRAGRAVAAIEASLVEATEAVALGDSNLASLHASVFACALYELDRVGEAALFDAFSRPIDQSSNRAILQLEDVRTRALQRNSFEPALLDEQDAQGVRLSTREMLQAAERIPAELRDD